MISQEKIKIKSFQNLELNLYILQAEHINKKKKINLIH